MLRAAVGLCCFLLLVGGGTPSVQAQNVGVVQSDILVLDADRLFSETRFGQRLTEDYQAEREKLIARNRELEAELEAEEKELTELRSESSPEEFRELADAFDEKVQEIRHDSDRAVRDLERSRERAPVMFMRRVEPVLVDLMRDAGGTVILEARNVLLRADVIDITDVAVTRIDEEIGDGLDEEGEPIELPEDGSDDP